MKWMIQMDVLWMRQTCGGWLPHWFSASAYNALMKLQDILSLCFWRELPSVGNFWHWIQIMSLEHLDFFNGKKMCNEHLERISLFECYNSENLPPEKSRFIFRILKIPASWVLDHSCTFWKLLGDNFWRIHTSF